MIYFTAEVSGRELGGKLADDPEEMAHLLTELATDGVVTDDDEFIEACAERIDAPDEVRRFLERLLGRLEARDAA
jgi:hypothetical protein